MMCPSFHEVETKTKKTIRWAPTLLLLTNCPKGPDFALQMGTNLAASHTPCTEKEPADGARTKDQKSGTFGLASFVSFDNQRQSRKWTMESLSDMTNFSPGDVYGTCKLRIA